MLVICCLAMSGCSWFEPPAEVRAQADELAEQVRGLDGVAEVTIDSYSRDFKDHPNDWIIRLDVTATNSDQLAVLPAPIAELASVPEVYAVNVTLTIPATISLAEVRLEDLGPEAVATAEEIRALPGVAAAAVTSRWGGSHIELKASAGLRQTADALRSVNGFGTSDLAETVTLRWHGAALDSAHAVEVGASGPAPSVLDALERLARDESVQRIDATENGPTTRPHITVEANIPELPLDILTAVRDEAVESGIRPRTRFTVESGVATSGYVGLPLGLPEPDDLPEPPAPAPGTPVAPTEVTPPQPWVPNQDPTVRAELANRAADITGFFAAAEQIAGVAGEHTIDEVPCDDYNRGSRMSGWTVVPIFQVADSAGEAFAAIVAEWESAGLTYSDRALGLDIYANRSDGAAITQATIRGTGEGINISVKSACVL